MALGQVTAPLTRSEQAAMAPGVAAASRFTNAAAEAGGVAAPVSKSFGVANDVPRREMRIDIEIISGRRNIIPN